MSTRDVVDGRELLAREHGVAGEPAAAGAISRRDALRLMAASVALRGLTACQRQPEEHLVPYVNPPEQVVPGNPSHYATACLVGGYAHGLLAESHEGRPTKVEGLPEHPATLGACDSVSQASVLALYDPDRSQSLRRDGRIAGLEALQAELQQRRRAWDADGGRGLRVLTGTVTSPSQAQAIEALLARWPEARWHVFEPVGREPVLEGARRLFGRALEPVYHFDAARVVVSLDADFLSEQPGFLRYAHDFVAQRRPVDAGTQLARLYVAESTPGLTGALADHVVRRSHDSIEALTRQLARALGLGVAAPERAVVSERWVDAVADDLRRHQGGAIVVPGDRQPAVVHAMAHAINHRLGAPGATLRWIEPVAAGGDAATLADLAEDVHAGRVEDLLVLDSNPAYSAPADLDFSATIGAVPWCLHWGGWLDETARQCRWHVPAAHALESWADARAYDGTVSLIQPLIVPLYDGRTALQLLALVGQGDDADARTLLMDHWRRQQGEDGFDDWWRRSLRAGLVQGSARPAVRVRPRQDWIDHLPAPAAAPAGELVLQFAPDPVLGDGRHANNAWLQELPRPLTKLTWDNALLMAPSQADQRGLAQGDVVRVESGGRSLELPVYPLPGQPDDAVTVHLGHGRRAAGRVGDRVGVDAFRLRTTAKPWSAPATLSPTGAHRELATTQHHDAMEGRDLVRAGTLEEFRANPRFAKRDVEDISLYPEPWPASRRSEHAWGMSIDLSSCIGCNACVSACQAENNIPVVGPDEVRRGHAMHWIRVDRYFDGPAEGPSVVFQPVPCMHCENAPCEYVCPVGATQHTASGLNEMLYQRCIGTRYCSQNCPYKVRRFNWFNYTDAAAAYPAVAPVQNPDVSVRTRGVMEKCTYCIQRINAAEIEASSGGRPLTDGRIQTACQQACPTQAIVFGDLADDDSEVVRRKQHPLDYALLAELNTRPRTTYLAAVRNPNPDIGDDAP